MIQFSTATDDYLVDPLALDDLSSLAPIFAAPEIEKIFHAAEYDLICLQRDFDFSFVNIFDTMLAARILGWERVGLASILSELYGIKLDKAQQRADWGARPLPSRLLAYARFDTHFLIPLREKLMAELKENGRWALAQEDFLRACRVRQPQPNDKDQMLWRINGARDLTPQQTAVLQKLCLYRDKMGQKYNRPLFKIISNRTLLALAAACPRTYSHMQRIPGMTQGQLRRYGGGLLKAVKTGRRAPPIRYSRKPRPAESYLNRYEAIRLWRKESARAIGVESDVVLPKDLMRIIAAETPKDKQALSKILEEVPYRMQHFGDDILRILRKAEKEKA